MFNFDDRSQYVHGTPYDALSHLRRQAPFAWHPTLSDHRRGFWLALKHRDIVAISEDVTGFAAPAPFAADPVPPAMWPMFPALAMVADNLLTFPHTKHAVFRAAAESILSRERIARTEDGIRAVCVEVLSDLADRSSFDFASDVALRVAAQVVLGQFLGAPQKNLARLTTCVLAIDATDDPLFSGGQHTLPAVAEELWTLGMDLLRRVKARPNGSLMSDFVHGGRIEDASIEKVFLAYWFPSVAGTFDTTANAIAGGMQALLQFPGQLVRLKADPRLLSRTVQEIMRWVSPILYQRRTAMATTGIRGVRIRKGETVVLSYASANRDEEVFHDPDSFDVARWPNPHLAFGVGRHACLGASLSSGILRIFLEEFLHRMPELQMDGEVVYTRSNCMNRIRVMPVRQKSVSPDRGARRRPGRRQR